MRKTLTLSFPTIFATILVGIKMFLASGVIAQDYPPCETMGRQPGTNGASWQQGATVTVIINSTDFPPNSPQRQKIEDAFTAWQNANTNSGVTFKFESGSAPPMGTAAKTFGGGIREIARKAWTRSMGAEGGTLHSEVLDITPNPQHTVFTNNDALT